VAKQKPPSNPQANLLRQMQRMQQDMATAQAALAEETVEGSAGGGVVKATVTGAGDLRAVSISPEVVDPEAASTWAPSVGCSAEVALGTWRSTRRRSRP